jgi:NADP-reducing hydrogenase subunit HndB
MKTIDRLKEIRGTSFKGEGKRITIGMATCGIAAGAGRVMNVMVEELKVRGIKDTEIKMTGCIGVCRYEPLVEVYDEKDSRTTYVNMDEEKARRVIAEHIVNNRVCSDLTITEVDKSE